MEALRPYFPPLLYDWLVRYSAASQARFLAELRPVVSAFVRFEGLDFENDPQVVEKLNQYLGEVQRLAAQYGGSVVRQDYGDKGSVLHVIFGAPVAHEDDELRAVGWTVDLQNAARQFPFITAQHIGMTRGQVYAGALGAAVRRGYTLMGDEVNASARLMQAAQPGQTLVSQRIMQAAQKRYMFHQFPGFQVKGKYEAVPVATPVAPLPPMPQMMPAGPLVGRDGEVAVLEEALNALMAGQGKTLRVEGDTGLGKTRLVAELVQKAMMRGVRTLVGSALSTSLASPYYPWREILNALFGLQPIWPAQQQAMQIQNMLQWINPEWIPRVPLLGDLLGLEIPDTPMTAAFDARLRRESLFALLGDLLARMAMQQPLLILIEDCHWADEASRALIEALALSLAGARVLLVVTHRPSDQPDRPILPGLAAAGHVKLQELAPASVQMLAAARLGAELPPDLLALIQERAQGIPLFVEELAETIRETSKLQAVGGHWQFTSTGDAQKLPDTIQGVVLARLDRLGEDARLTLSVASVAGRT
ncbi:MAG TPA: AAA family ATPase, partial [Giesbergeria sp.]|nr:AAA family ATPase [Giesbergeria sp.]